MPKSTIPEKWFEHASNYHTSRFEVTKEPGLVGRGIATTTKSENNYDERESAGSGNFVLPSLSNISNPRVLSDMGLAIPRPTRLGDPRSLADSSFEIIISLLIPR
jgi:hypothetical protein